MKTTLASWVLAGVVYCAAMPVSRADPASAVQAYNDFGFRLLAKCRKSLPATNYFLSPAGLAFALSMTLNGARGETLREIMAALQAQSFRPDQLNEANKGLLSQLGRLDPKVTLEIANSLWINQNASIKPEFLSVNRRDYEAEATTANFQDPAAVNNINDWVSRRTHGKIPGIVEAPLDPSLRLILLDAIYFKGDWQSPFDEKLTRDQPFTLAGGQVAQWPRMSRAGRYGYCEQDDFQMVELPYAGGDVSMFVFLPRKSLDEFLKKFTAAQFDAAILRLRPGRGTVELPRFKLENEYLLREVLSAMGMPLAFGARADLSGISDEPLRLSYVKQKTYVAVNEQGTVAAAVTSVGARPAAVILERPFHFVVDHPFFVAIREKQTGLVLFLGAINDPR